MQNEPVSSAAPATVQQSNSGGVPPQDRDAGAFAALLEKAFAARAPDASASGISLQRNSAAGKIPGKGCQRKNFEQNAAECLENNGAAEKQQQNEKKISPERVLFCFSAQEPGGIEEEKGATAPPCPHDEGELFTFLLEEGSPPDFSVEQREALLPVWKGLLKLFLSEILPGAASKKSAAQTTVVQCGAGVGQLLHEAAPLLNIQEPLKQLVGQLALPLGERTSPGGSSSSTSVGQLALPLGEGNLPPQAASLILSCLEQLKPLSEPHPTILRQLEDYLPEGASLQQDAFREEKPLPAFFFRLEELLKHSLQEGKEGQSRLLFTGAGSGTEGGQEAGGGHGPGSKAILPPGAAELFPSPDGAFQGDPLPKLFLYQQPSPIPQLNSRGILAQIVQRMHLFSRSGNQELRLQLQPDFLGEVLIRVSRMPKGLTAEIITSHPAVKELLEGHLETLRQRFVQMDLHVENCSVFVRDEGGNSPTFAGDHGERFLPRDRAALGDALPDAEESRLLPELRGNTGRVNYLV